MSSLWLTDVTFSSCVGQLNSLELFFCSMSNKYPKLQMQRPSVRAGDLPSVKLNQGSTWCTKPNFHVAWSRGSKLAPVLVLDTLWTQNKSDWVHFKAVSPLCESFGRMFPLSLSFWCKITSHSGERQIIHSSLLSVQAAKIFLLSLLMLSQQMI